MLNAGVGRVDISPPAGVAHAGWGSQTHQVSLGNDMPLLVTALVVANGNIELAIVDVDIGIFTTQQDLDIRQLISGESGIPFENIRLRRQCPHRRLRASPTDVARDNSHAAHHQAIITTPAPVSAERQPS